MQIKKVDINKILAFFLIIGSFGYYIPKFIEMVDWLNSGVISGYFYFLIPVNILIILFAIISILTFKSQYNFKKQNLLLANNIIGITAMILWFPFVFDT